MLTVLEPVPERGTDGSVKWLCRCNCGRYLVQSSNKLRMGRSVSCGCQTGIAAREAKTYIDGTTITHLGAAGVFSGYFYIKCGNNYHT